MNLNAISNRYKQNLKEFFNKEEVIRAIYETQYGKCNDGEYYYSKNESKCRKEYKDIMNNTIFIPYITLEHLEDLIESAKNNYGQKYLDKNLTSIMVKTMKEKGRKCSKEESAQIRQDIKEKYGQQFIEENFKNELNLLRELKLKKQDVIKQYTTLLLDDIKQMVPNLGDLEYNEIFTKCSDLEFEDNIDRIKEVLAENPKKISFIKNKKINKCLEKYRNTVQDKILMETSTYYQHTHDCPSGKYTPSILNAMKDNEAQVYTLLGKNKDKGFNYIFIPILKYKNPETYLVTATHEVMHISKGNLSRKKYTSGLIEETLNPQNSGALLENNNKIDTFFHNIKWYKFIKNKGLPKNFQKYEKSLGESKTEEILHDYQARKVTKKLIENGLVSLIDMPYHNEKQENSSVYEYPDQVTSLFMNSFEEKYQRLNRHEIKRKDFVSYLKNSDFKLFQHLLELWTEDSAVSNSNRKSFKTSIPFPKSFMLKQAPPLSQTQATISNDFNNEENKSMYTPQYTKLGEELVEKMKHNNEKNTPRVDSKIIARKKRNQILEKTRKIAAIDICEIGGIIAQKIKKQKITSQSTIRNWDESR